VDPQRLYALSQLVARLSRYPIPPTKPVVGEYIFMTESGVHQDGLLKDPASYLPFLPEQVGAPPIRLVLGKHSGRRAVRYRLEESGLSPTDEQIERVLKHLKQGALQAMYSSPEEVRELYEEVFPEREPSAVPAAAGSDG
jgi:isopropylmalate/homocitrate/citramalate synthase